MKKIILCLLVLIAVFSTINNKAEAAEIDLLFDLPAVNINTGSTTKVFTNGLGTGMKAPPTGALGYTISLPKKSVATRFYFRGYVSTNSYSHMSVKFLDKDGKQIGSVSYSNNQSGERIINPSIASEIRSVSFSFGGGSTVNSISLFGEWVEHAYPAGLKVTPGTNKADVSFVPLEDAIGYWIYLDGSKNNRITGNSYVLQGLEANRPVAVSVSAIYNEEGQEVESSLSPEVMVTPYAPDKPPELSVIAKWNELNLFWTNTDGGTGRFDVYVNNSAVKRSVEDNRYTYTAVPERKYDVYVLTTDRYGRAQKSNVVTVTTPEKPADTEPPSPPEGFEGKPSVDRKSIELSWIKGSESDLAGYNLYVKIDGQYIKINNSLITTPKAKYAKDIKIGKTYDFRLEALDTSGNVSEPADISIEVTPLPVTDSDQEETPEFLLVKWEPTDGAVSYNIYLNGRKVGSVGPNVFEFKITKAMGYRPGALENRAQVKAVFEDGTEGGGSGPGGDSIIKSPLNVVDVIKAGFGFLGLFDSWVLLMLAVIFAAIVISYLFHIVNRKPSKPVRRG